MMLVIGGVASGKRTFVRSLGYAEGDFAPAVLDGRPVLLDLQELLRGQEATPALLDALREKDVVVCVQVGCGVVPASAEEGAWRERVGRACNELAREASCVVRMVCGIPDVLKGDPWSS